MAMGRMQANLERAVRVNIASRRWRHPAHGQYLIHQLAGHFTKMEVKLPDDPLLAAPWILDRLPTIKGNLSALERWALSVNDCDPADANNYGARLLP